MGIHEFKCLANNIICFFTQSKIFLYEGTPNTLEDFLAFLINSDNDIDIETYIENFIDKNPNVIYPQCIFDGSENFHTFFPDNIRKEILNFDKWDLSALYIPSIDSDLDTLEKEKAKKSVSNNSFALAEINNKIYHLINNFLSKFQEQLKTILSNYYSNYIMPKDCITLLKRLFSICINLLDDVPFCDNFRKVYHKTTAHINYEQSDYASLKNTMEKNFRIIISGAKGSGKTTFIRDFINKIPFTDICYLQYIGSIEATLSQIHFSDASDTTLSYEEIYTRLKKKNGASILIIDDMNLSSNLLSKELEKIDSLNLRIFIITCNTLWKGTTYVSFSVPVFSDDKLIDYYKKICKISDLTQDFETRILKWTSKNPLLVSLLAYTSKKNPNAVRQLLFKEDYIFNRPDVSFKHPYDHQTQSLLGHIKKLYDITIFKHENKILKKYLIILSCFFNYTLPVSFLEKVIPEFDIINIEKLSALGFLTFSKELNTVQLSAPIADAIYAIEKPSIPVLEKILENITKYIYEFDILLQELSISNILYPLIKRLQKTVVVKNNAQQKEVSTMQSNWWSFVYICIEYYQSIGNYDAAKELIGLLEYPDKKTILYSQSPMDQNLFSLINIWARTDSSFEGIVNSLISTIEKDKMSLAESATRPELYMPNMVLCNYLASIGLDKIILRIVTQQYIFYPQNMNYEEHFKNLLNVINASEAPYPQIKKIYYKTSYTLLSASIETMTYDFISDFFRSIKSCENKVIKLQLLTVLACQCFNTIHYSIGTPRCIKITEFTENFLFAQLSEILNSCVFLPKYVFELCYFSFLRYKQFHLVVNKNILNLDTVFDYLIKKCSVLSSSEKKFYLSLKLL